MNPMKYFWGLVLTGVGVLMLGVNVGWWNSDIWNAFWLLWPMIFIVVGLRFLIDHDKIFMLIATAVVLLAGYLIIKDPTNVIQKLGGRSDVVSEIFSENYDKGGTDKLKLNLDLGASNVNFDTLDEKESEINLYKIETRNYGKLVKESETKDKELNVSFHEEFTAGMLKTKLTKRELTAFLSNSLPLELDLNSGASNLKMDFSNLKLTKLQIDSGASNGDLKFGNKVDVLDVKIDTGASKIAILIPKDTGLRIVMDSDGLNSKSFAQELELEKKNNTYETKNYNSAKHKINLEIVAGVSNITINQY